jgi:hypothetical protein
LVQTFFGELEAGAVLDDAGGALEDAGGGAASWLCAKAGIAKKLRRNAEESSRQNIKPPERRR